MPLEFPRAAIVAVLVALPGIVAVGQPPPSQPANRPAASTASSPSPSEIAQQFDDACVALNQAIDKAKLAEPKPGDDARRALLRQQLQAATTVAHGHIEAFKAGTTNGTIELLLESCIGRADAELALLDLPSDRVAALQRIATLAAAADAVNELRFKQGRITNQELVSTHQILATCQLAVLDAKTAPPLIRPKVALPPAPAPVPKETDPVKRKQARDKLIAEMTPIIEQILADDSIDAPHPADDERRKLLKERHRALQQGFAVAISYVRVGGSASTIGLYASLRQLAASAAELDNTPANLLAGAERKLLISQFVEAVNEGRFEAGRETMQEMATSQFNRLTAEIELLELRNQFPNVEPVRPNPVGPAKPGGGEAAASVAKDGTPAEWAEVRRVFGTDPNVGNRRLLPATIDPVAGDDERQRLLKMRRKWAMTELEARLDSYVAGPGPRSAALLEALDRYRTSALALAKTQEDRLAVEELVGLHTRAAAMVTQSRFNAGRITPPELSLFLAARAESQIRIIDAKTSATVPAQPPGKKP
jgi:hypothetical protein